MLRRDFLEEMIDTFTLEVTQHLPIALQEGNQDAIDSTEASVARLLELDPSYALGLAPQSLVMMLQLNGVGYALASYAAYVLHRVSEAYASKGDMATADLREQQAQAIAAAFNYDLNEVPEGLEALKDA